MLAIGLEVLSCVARASMSAEVTLKFNLCGPLCPFHTFGKVFRFGCEARRQNTYPLFHFPVTPEGAIRSASFAEVADLAWRKEFFVREKGTVKWFNGAKGYGFIQRSTGEDVFVHFSAIQENGYRTLNEGETVEFDLQNGPKGFQASNVSRG
jgi:CspA family cold shock protein